MFEFHAFYLAVPIALLLLLLLPPQGSLRSAIDSCLLDDRLTNRPNYSTVLSLGLGVARAMAHLHAECVIHGGER